MGFADAPLNVTLDLAYLGPTAAGDELVFTGATTPMTPGEMLYTCNGWTDLSGLARAGALAVIGPEAFMHDAPNCTTPEHLYCLEE